MWSWEWRKCWEGKRRTFGPPMALPSVLLLILCSPSVTLVLPNVLLLILCSPPVPLVLSASSSCHLHSLLMRRTQNPSHQYSQSSSVSSSFSAPHQYPWSSPAYSYSFSAPHQYPLVLPSVLLMSRECRWHEKDTEEEDALANLRYLRCAISP